MRRVVTFLMVAVLATAGCFGTDRDTTTDGDPEPATGTPPATPDPAAPTSATPRPGDPVPPTGMPTGPDGRPPPNFEQEPPPTGGDATPPDQSEPPQPPPGTPTHNATAPPPCVDGDLRAALRASAREWNDVLADGAARSRAAVSVTTDGTRNGTGLSAAWLNEPARGALAVRWTSQGAAVTIDVLGETLVTRANGTASLARSHAEGGASALVASWFTRTATPPVLVDPAVNGSYAARLPTLGPTAETVCDGYQDRDVVVVSETVDGVSLRARFDKFAPHRPLTATERDARGTDVTSTFTYGPVAVNVTEGDIPRAPIVWGYAVVDQIRLINGTVRTSYLMTDDTTPVRLDDLAIVFVNATGALKANGKLATGTWAIGNGSYTFRDRDQDRLFSPGDVLVLQVPVGERGLVWDTWATAFGREIRSL